MIPVAAILTLVSIAGAIVEKGMDDEKVTRWVRIGLLAAKGIKEAIDAKNLLEKWREEGHSPTDEELDALLAKSEEAHKKIQDA